MKRDGRTAYAMSEQESDKSVLARIGELVAHEHRLQGQEVMTDADRESLCNLKIELDQCWDLLRRRRALREIGQNPDSAHVRPPEVVEKYLQ